jgi:hypothetical protein
VILTNATGLEKPTKVGEEAGIEIVIAEEGEVDAAESKGKSRDQGE